VRVTRVPRAILRRIRRRLAAPLDDPTAPRAALDLTSSGVIELNGERFVAVPYYADLDYGDDLVMIKSAQFLERYQTFARSRPNADVVVELGIYQGGSTAYLFEAYKPRHLLAFDLATERAAALDAYVRRKKLEDRVHLHYGVDQGDQAKLIAAIAEVGSGRCVDLVSDDASHLYAPTRAAFEAVFPLLREGARYVIEDWNWSHIPAFVEEHADDFGQQPALTNLVVEMAMLLASRPDILRALTVENGMVVATRGEADVEAPMRLETLISNRGKVFSPIL
jgi:predicted O-methyltransferase YrrM